MDCEELVEFLKKLNLCRYTDVMQKAGFETYVDLKFINEDDLVKMDVKAPHIRRILFELKDIIVKTDIINNTDDINAKLAIACQSGNVTEVKKLLKAGASNYEQGLCCACSGGNKEIALLMIKAGARDFNRAFIVSCKSGNREMVSEMMSRGLCNISEGIKAAKKRGDMSLVTMLKQL